MKVTVIGLGLIGGSMAIDLRKAGIASSITGIDVNTAHAAKAVELHLVDSIESENLAVATADVIITAIPVSALVGLLPSILDRVHKHALVIDAGSTKTQICRALSSHSKRSQFVAAHPLAGLFRGKTNIICESEKSSDKALKLAHILFEALGLKTIYMEAEEHDKHVAYVSHLSHVSSFLLGQTVLDIEKDEKNIFDLASSGFASTVRLAKSSPDMWTPIFEQNSEYLGQALMEYIMHLQKFHYLLMKKDTKELHKIMSRANEIRRVLDGIELKGKQVPVDNNPSN
jgi:prephenate dehydrogenase